MEIQGENGEWNAQTTVENNIQRLVRVPVDARAVAIRFVPLDTWGASECRMFAFDVR
jgi:hypothetical protein